MDCYTPQECVIMISIFLRNNSSLLLTRNDLPLTWLCSSENISTVAKDDPGVLTRGAATQLGNNRRSLQRILVKVLKRFSYKAHNVHQLPSVHHQARVTYAQAILNHDQEWDNVVSKIIMSNEALSHLCGHLNQQNFRICETKNSRITQDNTPA